MSPLNDNKDNTKAKFIFNTKP